MNVLVYLGSILIPWTLKTLLYHVGFRWRHIHATLQTKIIVAGAPMVVAGFTPIALPRFVMFILAVGIGLYLCRKFTDGKIYPDLALIVGGTELTGFLIIDRLILPILV